MGFNTTDNRIHLVETTSPFNRVTFQFMPENFNWHRTIKNEAVSIVGRNNDLYHYSGGKDEVNFTIDFLSDEAGREDVLNKCNFLKSLGMNDGGFGKFKNVKLIMGRFLRDEVWIVDDVDVSYSNFDNFNEFLPLRATVKLRLVLDTAKNRRIKDVRG